MLHTALILYLQQRQTARHRSISILQKIFNKIQQTLFINKCQIIFIIINASMFWRMVHLTTREIRIACNFCHCEHFKLLINDGRNASLTLNALNI